MYQIYKGDEYFGVSYDNLVMALYVSTIFAKTLGCDFYIRRASNMALA